MSSLIVEVCKVEEIKSHPNADRVELVRVKNWWCVSGVGQFQVGDKCVYFPPDSVISEELANRFGISKYCSPLPKLADGERPPGLRIKAARFRGEPSFGTIQKVDDPTWEIGKSVLEYYGVTKFEPPPRSDGDAAPTLTGFKKYTDIEHLGNYPNVLVEGEEVIVEEKIHGSCALAALLRNENNEFVYVCGSHNLLRKEYDSKGNRSKFWQLMNTQTCFLLDYLSKGIHEVIIYGELYGSGIQDMAYGLSNQSFRIFDISVDGKYLDYDDRQNVLELAANYEPPSAIPGIQSAPHLYRGPFSIAKIKELTDGPTTLCDPDKAGKFKGREGVVVRPVKERYSGSLPNFGRVIFKSVSVDYLERKGGTEYH